MLSRVIDNISCCDLKNEDILKEVMNWRELILKKVLLDSRVTGLVMSSEFSLKKIERPILSRLQVVDFNYFHFYFFYFLLDLFSFILFLELRVKVCDNITWSHISHIR